MACRCEEIAGKDIALLPTCIGQLWIFQNLEAEEIEALSQEALRRKSVQGQALFLQGEPTDERFLIKGGRVKLSKVLENGTELTLDIRKAGDFVGENMFAEEGLYLIRVQGGRSDPDMGTRQVIGPADRPQAGGSDAHVA